VLGDEEFNTLTDEEMARFTEEAIAIDSVVDEAVAAYSLNPANIEAEIRRHLLPRLFKLVGMDKAKGIIEEIIGITRQGLKRG
jgi:type I restriction enzyme R subunit